LFSSAVSNSDTSFIVLFVVGRWSRGGGGRGDDDDVVEEKEEKEEKEKEEKGMETASKSGILQRLLLRVSIISPHVR